MTVTAGPAFVGTTRVPSPGHSDVAESLFRRYLGASLPGATPTATGARVCLRGDVRVRGRRLPFRAFEEVTPGHGFVRVTRLAGLVTVTDTAVPGETVRRVAVGRRTLWEDDSRDVARRAPGELALATTWAPNALPGTASVRRSAVDATTLRIEVPAESEAAPHHGVLGAPGVHLRLHPKGLPLSVRTLAWGDPTGEGLPDWFPYGGPVLEHRTWHGVTLPSTVVLGWLPDTPRWTAQVRVQITDWEPLGPVDTSAR